MLCANRWNCLGHFSPHLTGSPIVLNGKPILERYCSTQPLRTILFHVLLVSVLYELCATAGQWCLCVQLFSASSLPAARPSVVSQWQTVTEQSETDVLAPLVITDLKHRLQTGFVVSVGLLLLSATCVWLFNKPRTHQTGWPPVGLRVYAPHTFLCVCSWWICVPNFVRPSACGRQGRTLGGATESAGHDHAQWQCRIVIFEGFDVYSKFGEFLDMFRHPKLQSNLEKKISFLPITIGASQVYLLGPYLD